MHDNILHACSICGNDQSFCCLVANSTDLNAQNLVASANSIHLASLHRINGQPNKSPPPFPPPSDDPFTANEVIPLYTH